MFLSDTQQQQTPLHNPNWEFDDSTVVCYLFFALDAIYKSVVELKP